MSSVAAGDPVLLSFDHCKTCQLCKSSHVSFCQSFNPLNVVGTPGRFKTASEDVGGNFFGQSSFASLTPVHEACVVNARDLVKDREELKLFAPLGCGIQTGSASMINLGAADETHQVVITGLGGVGLSAIMAAKIQGCRTIIAVDRVVSRLELAKTLGATHALDTSPENFDLAGEIQKISGGGADIILDTTGVPAVVKAAAKSLGRMGKLIFVGIMPPDFVLDIPAAEWMAVSLTRHAFRRRTDILYDQTGRRLIGSIEGDAIPSKWVPQMVRWYREGKFPLDKLNKYYPVGSP